MHGPLDEHLHTEECNVIIRELQRCHQVTSKKKENKQHMSVVRFNGISRRTACSNSFSGRVTNLTGQSSCELMITIGADVKIHNE